VPRTATLARMLAAGCSHGRPARRSPARLPHCCAAARSLRSSDGAVESADGRGREHGSRLRLVRSRD
jgi:hypothetical protein